MFGGISLLGDNCWGEAMKGGVRSYYKRPMCGLPAPYERPTGQIRDDSRRHFLPPAIVRVAHIAIVWFVYPYAGGSVVRR